MEATSEVDNDRESSWDRVANQIVRERAREEDKSQPEDEVSVLEFSGCSLVTNAESVSQTLPSPAASP